MKGKVLLQLLGLMVVCGLCAQEHLEPETGVLANPDRYSLKVQEVFSSALTNQAVCQAVILASFEPERMVGLQRSDKGIEAFSLSPSSTIWDTEVIALHESGEIETWDTNFHKLSLAENESYQALKKATPADYRSIKVTVKAQPIDEALGGRIATVWKRMLMGVRHPKEKRAGCDGVTYHFSMWIKGRGILSGQVWSPDSKSRTAALVELTEALSRYAEGNLNAAELGRTVLRAEKAAKS